MILKKQLSALKMKNLFETPVTLYDPMTIGNLIVVVLIAAAIFGTMFYKMANPKLK